MPRRDFSNVPFAATGDTNVIPDAVQPDGSISLPQGWGFDYQRDNGAGGGTPDPLAKNIDREDMNGILNEITASIGEVQKNGFPIWVVTAAPFPINAMVRHSDNVWLSLVTNNSEEPGTGAQWQNFPTSVAASLRTVVTRVISSTSSYVPTAGMSIATVELVGGGAGGGGALGATAPSSSAAGGGGSGGYVRKTYTAAQIGASAAIVIGTAGTGGAAGINNGGNGGATTFTPAGAGAVLTGGGGTGSQGSSAGNGIFRGPGLGGGGTATGGDINIPGDPGGWSFIFTSSQAISGRGGNTPFGRGGQESQENSAGNTAVGFGGGGGGGASAATSRAGGNGLTGVVVITEYITQ